MHKQILSNPKIFESKYIIKDFDQMTKIVDYFLSESIEKLNEANSESDADFKFEKLTIILQKYLLCLKSQQNLNSIFNRFCNQILFNLLNLIVRVKQLHRENKVESDCKLIDLVWSVVGYSLLSKYHSNVYMEFFKNLPNSFSSKSNYLVSVFFTTIQNETKKNFVNLKSFCENAYQITKKLYQILNLDYKQNITVIQLVIDLVWSLSDVKFESTSQQDINDSIVKALSSLINLVDELNLFNQVDDNSNGNLFKNWCKDLIKKSFKFKFNENYSTFLANLLKLDHLILEQDLELILTKLSQENNLDSFLRSYFDLNIKFRQFSRATLKLIENIRSNGSLSLPQEFYNFYGTCLENYNVDVQTLVNLWKEVNASLEACPSDNKNLHKELTRILNCILLRINLNTHRMPSNLRSESLKQLNDSKTLILNTLCDQKNPINDKMVYLDCFFSCGLVYIINYRFSLKISSNQIAENNNNNNNNHDEMSLNYLHDFLNGLNVIFNLNEQLDKELECFANFNMIYSLNKLQLINVYAANMIDVQNNHSFLDYLFNSVNKINIDEITTENFAYENFDIQTKINNKFEYAILHMKNIITDNIYLILPLIKSNKDLCQQTYKFVFQLILKNSLKLDDVNRNSLFNDNTLLVHIFTAFIESLIALGKNDANIKFLKKIKENLENDNLKSILFDNMNDAIQLNQEQTNLYSKILEYVPIEYINNVNASFVCFILNEKSLNDLNIYSRLMVNNEFIYSLPSEMLKRWLLNLLFASKHRDSLFEKLVKKCINALIREQSYQNLADFVDNLFSKLDEDDQDKISSTIRLSLIHILDRIIKTQEILASKESVNSSYVICLNEMLTKIFSYFIKLNEADTIEEEIENHNFYICSNLMRHLSLKEENNGDLASYFSILLKQCLKNHKHKMKQLKKLNKIENDNEEIMDLDEPFSINFYHINFLKSYMIYSNRLKSNNILAETEKFKIYKDLLKIYLYSNENGELLLNVLTQSINNFDMEEFKKMIDLFDSELNNCFLTKSNNFLKLATLFKYACCDFDMNEEFKEDYSTFIQKFLVQIHPIFYNLLQENIALAIELLNLQLSICSSKYILLPSHLVISTLQIYFTITFDKISLNEYVQIQELACKTTNLILTRYSKKFQKIAAIICNLFIKLICQTTSISNQSNLSHQDQLLLALKAAQDLERVLTQFLLFKKDFSKISPYLITEFVCRANLIPIHPSIKNTLTNAMFNLISLCDIHGISQLHVTLPVGPKELFKNIYSEYEKYFKYTGKA